MSHWAPFSFINFVIEFLLVSNLFIENPSSSLSNSNFSFYSFHSRLHIILALLLLVSKFIELAPLVPPYCRSVWSVDSVSSAGKTTVCWHTGKETFRFCWNNKHRFDTICNWSKVEARATTHNKQHSMTSTPFRFFRWMFLLAIPTTISLPRFCQI